MTGGAQMDPNTALEELRALLERASAATTNEECADLYGEAHDKFRALDEWLGKGGFLPAEWADAGPRS
jgi:hypothetical protein